jgi:hypothetical protein
LSEVEHEKNIAQNAQDKGSGVDGDAPSSWLIIDRSSVFLMVLVMLTIRDL